MSEVDAANEADALLLHAQERLRERVVEGRDAHVLARRPGRAARGSEEIVEPAAENRHGADLPLRGARAEEQVSELDHLELDRVLAHVSDLALEQVVGPAVAVVESLDELGVGLDRSERRLVALSREGEACAPRPLVGRPEDDEQVRLGGLGEGLPAPGVGVSAPVEVDVG